MEHSLLGFAKALEKGPGKVPLTVQALSHEAVQVAAELYALSMAVCPLSRTSLH
jgi:hypothetical protein